MIISLHTRTVYDYEADKGPRYVDNLFQFNDKLTAEPVACDMFKKRIRDAMTSHAEKVIADLVAQGVLQ